jgi:ABC-2 type transport system permease protein
MALLAQRGATAATVMFATVFRWEIRAMRRDPASWAALVFACAALVFAVLNGVRWRAHLDSVAAAAVERDISARTEARARAARLDAEADPPPFVTRDPRSPFGFANGVMAHYAVLSATPLAALTTGQSDLLPSVLPLAPASLPTLAAGSEPENPHRLLIGRFDAAFTIVFLLPLVIIALTYALFSGERERGTLALLLAQPVTPRSLFSAKLAARVLLVLGLLVLFAVVVAAAMPAKALPRLALWFAVVLAYAFFWFALSAAVVVRQAASATHAVALAAAWIGLTLLAPAAINLCVKTLAPMPSRIELILALRTATDAAAAERSKLLGAFYEDHPELAPAGRTEDFVTLQLVTSQRIERDIAPVLASYQHHLARQQTLIENLQFLSPALLAQSALADAAGTGMARHHRFFGQVIAHHSELRAFFDPLILRNEKFTGWDDVPRFRYVEEPVAEVVARIGPAVAALLLAALAFSSWSARTLSRSSPVS